MGNFSRRTTVKAMLTGGSGLALAPLAGAAHVIADATKVSAPAEEEQAAVPSVKAFRGQHQPKPLPFDPAKLKGLSEKLLRSHWENNYGGAVKALTPSSSGSTPRATTKTCPLMCTAI